MTDNKVGKILADNHANAPKRMRPVELEISTKKAVLDTYMATKNGK